MSKTIGVSIPSTLNMKGGSKEYTVYRVQVDSGHGSDYVDRRYSEFYEVNAMLKRTFPHEKFAPFPPKKLFGSLSPSVINSRQEGLEKWLRDIVSKPQVLSHELITKFLNLEGGVVGLSPTEQLFVASRDGDQEAVSKLVRQADVDVNASFQHSYRALDRAASRGYLGIVKLLVDAGARVNATDDAGDTALHLAAQEGYADVVEYLASKSSNIDATDLDGDTPLILASSNGHLDIVRHLVEMGANMELQGESSCTAIHWAATAGHAAVVKFLHSKGASLANLNAQKNSILGSAVLAKHASIVEYLLKAGVNVDQKGEDGDTALHLAAGNGELALVKLLLDHKADPNVQNDDGLTPLSLALRFEYSDVVDALKRAGATAPELPGA